MFSLRQTIDKFQKIRDINIYDVAARVAEERQDVLMDMNRDQLLQGRNADGILLSPEYTNDPYFKTQAGAEKYAKMKQGLEKEHRLRMTLPELYGEKPANVPNLIVTGPFQNSFFIRISEKSYTIGATYIDAEDISAKYNHRVHGIAPLYKSYYYFHFIRTELFGLYKK
jgi:hypothetical protein